MVGEDLLLRSIFLLFFIITMISAASLKHSIERTNNGSSVGNRVRILIPVACTYGVCIGGSCIPCPIDPLRCYNDIPSTCYTSTGVPYGYCVPVCSCYGAKLRKLCQHTVLRIGHRKNIAGIFFSHSCILLYNYHFDYFMILN